MGWNTVKDKLGKALLFINISVSALWINLWENTHFQRIKDVLKESSTTRKKQISVLKNVSVLTLACIWGLVFFLLYLECLDLLLKKEQHNLNHSKKITFQTDSESSKSYFQYVQKIRPTICVFFQDEALKPSHKLSH